MVVARRPRRGRRRRVGQGRLGRQPRADPDDDRSRRWSRAGKAPTAPASHFTVVQPGGTVGDLTHDRVTACRGSRRRARRSCSSRGRPGARDRRGDGAGQAPRAARRRHGPLDRARARTRRRDVHPHHAGDAAVAGVRDARAPARRSARPRCGRSRPGRRGAGAKPGASDRRDAAQPRPCGWPPRSALPGGRRRAPQRLRPLHVDERQDVLLAADAACRSPPIRTTCVGMMTARGDPERRRRVARPPGARDQRRVHLSRHHRWRARSDADAPRRQRRPQHRHLPHQQLVQADGQRQLRSDDDPTTRRRWR